MTYTINSGVLISVSTNIVDAQIPSEVTSLGESCFGNSKNSLVSVDFDGTSVISIGISAFRDCFHLSSIKLEKCVGLNVINNQAFWQCFSLENIIIPPTVTFIGKNCFRLCKLKQTIHLSSQFTYIHGTSFLGTMCSFTCDSNNPIFEIYEGNIYDKAFSMLIAVSFSSVEVIFPIQANIIGDSAFSTSNLTEIIIPKTILTLSTWSFHCANFTRTIFIPGSISTIGLNVFHTLPSLDRIIFSEGTTTLVSNSISNCPALRTIIFPSTLIHVDLNSFQSCPIIEYVSYFSNSLIETYHLGGIPLRALIRNITHSCHSYIYSTIISFIHIISFVN